MFLPKHKHILYHPSPSPLPDISILQTWYCSSFLLNVFPETGHYIWEKELQTSSLTLWLCQKSCQQIYITPKLPVRYAGFSLPWSHIPEVLSGVRYRAFPTKRPFDLPSVSFVSSEYKGRINASLEDVQSVPSRQSGSGVQNKSAISLTLVETRRSFHVLTLSPSWLPLSYLCYSTAQKSITLKRCVLHGFDRGIENLWEMFLV